MALIQEQRLTPEEKFIRALGLPPQGDLEASLRTVIERERGDLIGTALKTAPKELQDRVHALAHCILLSVPRIDPSTGSNIIVDEPAQKNPQEFPRVLRRIA